MAAKQPILAQDIQAGIEHAINNKRHFNTCPVALAYLYVPTSLPLQADRRLACDSFTLRRLPVWPHGTSSSHDVISVALLSPKP